MLSSRKRPSDASSTRSGRLNGYRGERRSTRLGNAPAIAFDESEQALLPPAAKRAKTSPDAEASPPSASSTAAVVAVPPPPGKKKSKFWFYAVDPTSTDGSPSGTSTPASSTPGPSHAELNGSSTTNGINGIDHSAAPSEAGVSLIDGMEGVELTDGQTAVSPSTGEVSTNENIENGNENGAKSVEPSSPDDVVSPKMDVTVTEEEKL